MSPTGSHLSLRERRAFIVLAPEQLQLLGGAPGRREQPASRRSIEPAFRIDAQQLGDESPPRPRQLRSPAPTKEE
jgi:hypothetical protein